MTAPITLYFDLGSPFAYLACTRSQSVLGESVRWQPLSLGALFKLTGRSSWSLGDVGRRRAGMGEVERRALAYDLPPICWPQPWPGNYLMAMRAAVFADRQGCGREFAEHAFRHAFVCGCDLSRSEQVLAAAAAAGLDPGEVNRASADPAIKLALRDITDAAHRLGVRGVPTVAVGEELFWGDDRLEDAARAAAAARV